MLQKFTGNAGNHARVQALNGVSASIMLTDDKLNITYMNPAARELLQGAEADLMKELHGFKVSNLIGRNIDVFFKNSPEQGNTLIPLRERHSTTLWVSGRVFDLVVTPLIEGGKRTGFAVEWAYARARLLHLDHTAQIAAISRAQAVIEFKVDGTVITANENFLRTMGYSLQEIQGRRHEMFVDPTYRQSREYAQLWEKLGRGEYIAAEFERIAKDGRIITIQGSYNPILDANGKVIKIVKFATDVTKRVESVHEIGTALTGLANGDLMQRIEKPFMPELDKLRLDFNSALETLQGAMQQVGQATMTIRSGAAEIRSSSDDLSKRTEQQASSLEETAAALDEITATVKRTADGAVEARKVVAAAKADAEKSGMVVGEAVDAMSRIQDSSRQISQIIGVIDEIAFQTNLLALNAGVEAARAGDAGRGFAVVASEVRALAQRSAEAAKEIKTLISASTEQVAYGVERVGETGQALARIADQVSKINNVVADISSSTQEQATGLQQVNAAVNQMDQVTQQNAAMVEEATAAAHALGEETGALAHLIGKFRYGEAMEAARNRPTRSSNPVHAAQRKIASSVGGSRDRGAAAVARAVDARADSWEEF